MDKTTTIEHAKFALANVQSNIQFVDKKVGAAITILSVTLGFIVPKGIIGKQILLALDMFPSLGGIVILLITVIAAHCLGLVVYHAIKTMTPRPPPKDDCEKRQCVLFPYAVGNAAYEKCKSDISDKLSKGMPESEQLEEFERQIPILGWIQAQKMTHCERMFGACLYLAGLVFVLTIVCLIVNQGQGERVDLPSSCQQSVCVKPQVSIQTATSACGIRATQK